MAGASKFLWWFRECFARIKREQFLMFEIKFVSPKWTQHGDINIAGDITLQQAKKILDMHLGDIYQYLLNYKQNLDYLKKNFVCNLTIQYPSDLYYN